MLPKPRSLRPYGLTASLLLSLCAGASLWFDAAVRHNAQRDELLCRYLFVCADLAATRGFQSYRNGEPLASSIGEFKSAVSRDAASPFRWCDLADACLAAGDVEQARYCISRAKLLGPHSPIVQLRSAGFYLRAGDSQTAISGMAALLQDAPRYDDIVFSYYRRIGLSVSDILERGMPVDS